MCHPPPASWYHACARNHARNYNARLRLHPAVSLSEPILPGGRQEALWGHADETPGSETWLRRESNALQMQNALRQLPMFQRYLLCQHHVQGESIAEIAAETGRAESTVKTELFRARKRLRQLWEEQGE